jgi:hypothetical protein
MKRATDLCPTRRAIRLVANLFKSDVKRQLPQSASVRSCPECVCGAGWLSLAPPTDSYTCKRSGYSVNQAE